MEEGNSLNDICYAPLSSPFTGPITTSQCVVQSVWGYFQNDIETFNFNDTDSEGYETNYLDHIKKCSK